VVLTFDDGYVDNWVFAFPILRKHGFKGTVFVSTDFVDRRNKTRLNLDDVWQGRAKHEDLTWRGFLCEDEMRRLITSDLFEVQAHCKTHTWYPIDEQIVDFHHPGDAYPWLAWNARPDRKYAYLEEDQSGFVPFGSPIYAYDKALVAHRYFPDPDVEKSLAGYVQAHGGRRFFSKRDWKQELDSVANQASSQGRSHRRETEKERVTRLKEEIVLSKQELENMLGRPVEYLCWPGGAYDDMSVELASDAGFRAWTTGSKFAGKRRNVPGEDPAWIRRTAATPWWSYKGRRVCAMDGALLRHVLEAYKGYAFSGFRLKWLKAGRLLRSYFR
jgi:peptidoglycan/xylan/chitin deacetylase (PgdA/CDA1 family)